MNKIKLFDRAFKDWEKNPTKENEKNYWKKRNKLVLEFQHKQGLDDFKPFEKDNDVRYYFGTQKENVPTFTFGLIYNDLSHNIYKGLVFEYLDYCLEEKNPDSYIDWYFANGYDILNKYYEEKVDELFDLKEKNLIGYKVRQDILNMRNEINEIKNCLNKLEK